MLTNKAPIETKTWTALQKHYQELKGISLSTLFHSDSNRFEQFSHHVEEQIYIDFSKNRITQQTLDLFEELFTQMNVKGAIEAMFSGKKINVTEQRAVLHTALRQLSSTPIIFEDNDVTPAIRQVRQQIKTFSNKVISGEWKGYTGKPITDIVNIGIGGSDLGSKMVVEGLQSHWVGHIKPHFVANIDAENILDVLRQVNHETTLFIVASKSFTTQETMKNAHTARTWFLEQCDDENAIAKHFVAVSTNKEAVVEFGISPQQQFEFWSWVGGRYSLTSAIGLIISCTIGYNKFEELLRGFYAADTHFRTAPFQENIPMLMAAIGIWYNNFFEVSTEAIIPYHHHLRNFATYMQQVNMESNGKSIDRDGKPVNYQTGSIVFGEPGSNSQHSFFQLIHQGTKIVPIDFIAVIKANHQLQEHQDILLANCFAQSEALMQGKKAEDVINSLLAQGCSEETINQQLPFRIFEGGKPSTTIVLQELTPYTLGYLTALYEHKVFVQGVVWNIYSFDQWGVELGKELAKKILQSRKEDTRQDSNYDSSTKGLLNLWETWEK